MPRGIVRDEGSRSRFDSGTVGEISPPWMTLASWPVRDPVKPRNRAGASREKTMSTTQDIIDTLLKHGWRWEQLDGEPDGV